MSFLSQFERRFGKYAVSNLTASIVICQVACYLMQLLGDPEFVTWLTLTPEAIRAGEVWRFFTFLCVPPALNEIFAIFYFWLLYVWGRALEQELGDFKYNVYLLIGYIANIGVALIALPFAELGFVLTESAFISTSVFLAFAYVFPDFELLLFFVLPVKIKWLALLMWFGCGLSFLAGLTHFSQGGWLTCLLILASVCNFFLFFGRDLFQKAHRTRQKATRNALETQRRKEPRHRCAICGVTDQVDPKMDFRYCTQCEGTPGYCTEHIHNHQHLVAAGAPAEFLGELSKPQDRAPATSQPVVRSNDSSRSQPDPAGGRGDGAEAAGDILEAELVSAQPADDSPDAGNQDVPATSPLLTLVAELSEARRLGDEHTQIIQRSLGQVLELTIEVERVAATYRSSIDASHHRGTTITGTIAGSQQSVELLTLNESHIGGLVRGAKWQGFAVVSDWDALYQRLRMLESPRG